MRVSTRALQWVLFPASGLPFLLAIVFRWESFTFGLPGTSLHWFPVASHAAFVVFWSAVAFFIPACILRMCPRWRVVGVGWIILLYSGVAVGVEWKWAIITAEHAMPSEEQMIEWFHASRQRLDRAVQMARDDFGSPWPERDAGDQDLSAERLQEYREVLSSVLPDRTWKPEDFLRKPKFTVWAVGTMPDGMALGYVYLQDPCAETVDSLEQGAAAMTFDHFSLYRPITEHWYLFRKEWSWTTARSPVRRQLPDLVVQAGQLPARQ